MLDTMTADIGKYLLTFILGMDAASLSVTCPCQKCAQESGRGQGDPDHEHVEGRMDVPMRSFFPGKRRHLTTYVVVTNESRDSRFISFILLRFSARNRASSFCIPSYHVWSYPIHTIQYACALLARSPFFSGWTHAHQKKKRLRSLLHNDRQSGRRLYYDDEKGNNTKSPPIRLCSSQPSSSSVHSCLSDESMHGSEFIHLFFFFSYTLLKPTTFSPS